MREREKRRENYKQQPKDKRKEIVERIERELHIEISTNESKLQFMSFKNNSRFSARTSPACVCLCGFNVVISKFVFRV